MFYNINEYVLLKSLGMGAFGEVYLAHSSKDQKFALKKIPISWRDKEQVKQQAKVSVTLEHENLIKTKEFFFFDEEKFLVIVMEYCPDGNLDDQIGRIQQPHIEGLMKQIVNGLVYLHYEQKIIHRDIKPENILMSNGIVKIADLGLARLMKTSGVSTKAGTPFYLAPEIFVSDKYHVSADIWSLGLTFLELLLGDRIFNLIQGVRSPAQRLDFPQPALLNRIHNEVLRKLVSQMLQKDPQMRPTAKQIKQILSGKVEILNEIMVPNPIIIKTGTFQSPRTLEPIPDYDCSYIYASHENYYGANTKDIVATFGNTNKLTLPYGGACGWKGGAYMMIAVHPSLGKKVKVLTGSYNNPVDIPIPEGFKESECKFIWFSQENYYSDKTKDVVFGFGNTKRAGMPYDGKCGWKSGVWMVIAYKQSAPIRIKTGTHSDPHIAPIPQGSLDSRFFWGSEENYYGGNTKDVVPVYGVTQNVRMPYDGKCGWKGGAWMSIGLLFK